MLVIGDSTGVGVGAIRPRLSLPGLIPSEFGRLEVVNRCQSGARIRDASRQAMPFVARRERFDVVLITAGGNDVLHMSPSRDVNVVSRSLLHRLHRIADHVVWMGCADVGGAPALLPPMSWWFSWRTQCVSKVIARAADGSGADFIDFSTAAHSARFAAAPETYFASDGLHPTGAAYRYCFDVLKQRLQGLGVQTDGRTTRSSIAAAVS